MAAPAPTKDNRTKTLVNILINITTTSCFIVRLVSLARESNNSS